MHNLIAMDEASMMAFIDRILEEMENRFGKTELEWIQEVDAMQILGIRSKTTLQRLRDEDLIRFTQPSKKIILYHRQSLLEYLEAFANK